MGLVQRKVITELDACALDRTAEITITERFMYRYVIMRVDIKLFTVICLH